MINYKQSKKLMEKTSYQAWTETQTPEKIGLSVLDPRENQTPNIWKKQISEENWTLDVKPLEKPDP